MNSHEKVGSERLFQVLVGVILVILGAILGHIATRLQYTKEESSRKEAALRLMCCSIRNDLSYTVGTTAGLRENILKKMPIRDAAIFRLLYHPSVILPDFTEVGRLDTSVVSAFDEYKRMLAECETRRQEHIQALQSLDHNNVEDTLQTYLIGLDAAILRGTTLLREIEGHYPAMSGLPPALPSYQPLQGFMKDLDQAMNEAIAERLKTQHVANSADPTAPPKGRSATAANHSDGLGEGRPR